MTRLIRLRRRVNGTTKKLSHITWHKHTGHWPINDEVIHHINGDSTDDRIKNLQLMSRAEHQSLHINKNLRIGDKHPSWKGDNATPHSKYMRIWRAKRRMGVVE